MSFIVGFFIYSLVPAGRLLIVTTAVNLLINRITETKHLLNKLEIKASGHEEMKSKLKYTMRRYDIMSEGFSAANYFKVNRGLVTSIAGYLLTYIIVLMQFKISDIRETEQNFRGNENIFNVTLSN